MNKILIYFGIALLLMSYTSNIQAETIDSRLDTSIDSRLDSNVSETDLDIESDNTVTSSPSNVNSTASAKVSDSIKFERDDMEGASDTTEMIDAGSVNTEADLSVYARSIILTDQNIKEINFEKDKVEIIYQKEGKILGLFNRKYDIETKVDSDGKTEVDYPWYAALIRGSNKPQVRERMEKEVSIFLDKNTNASGEIELNASVEATLANLIHTILVEELNGGVSLGLNNNESVTNQ